MERGCVCACVPATSRKSFHSSNSKYGKSDLKFQQIMNAEFNIHLQAQSSELMFIMVNVNVLYISISVYLRLFEVQNGLIYFIKIVWCCSLDTDN